MTPINRRCCSNLSIIISMLSHSSVTVLFRFYCKSYSSSVFPSYNAVICYLLHRVSRIEVWSTSCFCMCMRFFAANPIGIMLGSILSSVVVPSSETSYRIPLMVCFCHITMQCITKCVVYDVNFFCPPICGNFFLIVFQHSYL